MSEELEGVAIVGMSGRFPGAGGVEAFWRNLEAGVESVSTFSAEELAAAGVAPEQLADPRYVRRWGALQDVDCFDAAFFGITRRDAELIDPQQRLLLQCAWEALESAGYAASRRERRVGVYAGAGFSHYLLREVAPDLGRITPAAFYRVFFGSDKDFLCTRVAHALDLTGPAITVQTACSTSLVAVCQAALQLLTHQCDLALAGGTSVRVPSSAGYLYEEGGTSSPDGVCRAFDAGARGAVWGSGVGLVALKRLEDAVRDRDHVYAVIKGFAVNNDGAEKAGFAAPSVSGQAEVVARSLAMAGFDARTVGYVEAHGTATALGDPIEVAALTQAYRSNIEEWKREAPESGQGLPERGYCALGSVKTNVGHLDTASGVTGLIKAALCVQRATLPASLHFTRPNPHIDFAASPFFVNAARATWPERPHPRRAGVSSFGIGGTNAHVVLEQAPASEASDPARPYVLLPLSAKTPGALERAGRDLATWLAQHPGANLGDVAYSLQVGREAWAERKAVLCRSAEEAIAALAAPGSRLDASSDPLAQRLAALGRTWLQGAPVDWRQVSEGERRSRIPLPTYSFERERYWVERRPAPAPAEARPTIGLYSVEWKALDLRAEPGRKPLLFVGEEAQAALARSWVAALERAGWSARHCAPASLREALAGAPSAAVVRLWPAGRAPDQAVSALAGALAGFQDLLRQEQPREVTWLTEGAQSASPDPALTGLWGLGRSLELERSPVRVSLLDVERLEAVDPLLLAAALCAPERGPETVLRGGRLHAPQLAPASSSPGAPLAGREGAVLVTGGLGALGLHLAGHLVRRHGVRALVLASRGAPSEAQRAAVAALEGEGARVTVASVDVADREALARLVRAQPLRGVIHAAGVLDDGIAPNLTQERVERVLRPKVLGAQWLHELTRELPLDFFVLFSSIASRGSPGQASYAAANAFLEGLARARRASGLPALSIGWGPWARLGMAARAQEGQPRPQRRELSPIEPEEGARLFDACLAQAEPVVFVAGPEVAAPEPRARPEGQQAQAAEGAGALASLPLPERTGRLRQLVRAEVARLLSLGSPEAVPMERPFAELGMDSLMEVELRSSLSGLLGRALPGSILFDHPSVEALAQALAESVAEAGPAPAGAAQAPRAASAVCRLHPESPNPPLFLIGGAVGADALYLRDLATALGPLQPAYALLYPGMTWSEEPLREVGALADYFVAQVQAFQPSGPYALGGHSLGGVIAFEVASRLARLGQPVVELLLLDAPLFAPEVAAAPGSPWAETSLRGYLARLEQVRWIPPELRRAIDEASRSGDSWRLFERMWDANMAAMRSYRPARPYHGEATFITPANDAEGLSACLGLWREACPALKVARSSGNHITMVRAPHVEKTARLVRSLLSPALDDGA